MDGPAVSDGVEARALVQLLLESVELGGDRPGGGGRGDAVTFDHEYPGVVAALDTGGGESEQAIERGGHVTSSEQEPGRLRDSRGRGIGASPTSARLPQGGLSRGSSPGGRARRRRQP